MDNTFLFRFVDDGLLWLRAYVMGTLARLVYYGRDAHANYVADATGGTVQRIDEPSVEGLPMELWDLGYGRVLTFQGTIGPAQLLWQFNGAAQTEDPEFPGRVMEFYARQAREHWVVLNPILNNLPNKPTILVGHSYGGGMAQLVGHLLMKYGQAEALRGVYSFASPRIGDPVYASQSNFTHFRFANQEDFVPDLPPRTLAAITIPPNPVIPNLNGSRFQHHGRGFEMLESGEVYSDALGILPPTTAHRPLHHGFGFFSDTDFYHWLASHLVRIRGRFRTMQNDRFNALDFLNTNINAEENLLWGFGN